jgi:hypothetical protein
MTWTALQRAYFFGEQTVSGQRDDDVSDTEFLQRYCSEQIRIQLDRGGVPPRAARRVIEALARLAPSGDHASPKWSTPSSAKPVIAIGRARFRSGEPPKAEIRGPRFGCCIHEGHLHLWAHRNEIEQSGMFVGQAADQSPWKDWSDELLCHKAPLDLEIEGRDGDQLPWVPGTLGLFIKYLDQRLLHSVHDVRHVTLLEVLRPCREALGDPGEWDVIYPRLAAEMDARATDDLDAGGRPSTDLEPFRVSGGRGRERDSPPIPVQGAVAPTLGTDPDSMLHVLRNVAVARVRTVVPEFDHADLDRWIMSTGYADAVAPQADCGDLLYVFASSITNAGGAKPQAESFGRLIRAAYGTGGLLSQHGPRCLTGNFPDQRRLAQACLPHLHLSALGGRFEGDIRDIAEHRIGRMLMPGLLGSVLEFSGWLLARYDGNAAQLHNTLTVLDGTRSSDEVFRLLRDLDALPWMGIATAANFIKDSQVPGLLLMGLNPRTARDVSAGWFAKPDLHVARLMAYLTGRCPQPGISPSAMRLGRALAVFRQQPEANFAGDYRALSAGDGLDMKVIADIHEWAAFVGTSPLEIDRVLYLIGVRETVVSGVAVSAPWYTAFVRSVDAALNRGIPRKS